MSRPPLPEVAPQGPLRSRTRRLGPAPQLTRTVPLLAVLAPSPMTRIGGNMRDPERNDLRVAIEEAYLAAGKARELLERMGSSPEPPESGEGRSNCVGEP